MKTENDQNPVCGQMHITANVYLSATQSFEHKGFTVDGGQTDGADSEFKFSVHCVCACAGTCVRKILLPSLILLSICPPSSKQAKINNLRADRYKNPSVRRPSASVRQPHTRKVPGFWTVRERVIARGLEPRGGWIGGVTCAAMNGYQKRWLAMPRAERISHYEQARNNGETYLFPDAWLDLLDAAIDRVYFKTPIQEGIA